QKILINRHQILVEIASNPLSQAQGLSGRESLPKNQGMLFVYQTSAIRPFWMNQMRFNLDFVFIKNNQVVDLLENVPFPQSGERPVVVKAKKPFDQILELNAGIIKNLGIKVGQEVKMLK
ncbi:DUF192 domain-containing protein, partial [Patescibacteria group bacterium]